MVMGSDVQTGRATPPTAVSKALFPFDGHYFDRGGGIRMHYLDEGAGDPVVMVHGNPTWSFYYRNLVRELARGAGGAGASYRCIVPDHVGCGYSDKPSDAAYTYTLEQRIDDLEALLEHLGVRERVTLVVHDWGGMIGMGYATRHPDRVARIVLLNTGAFHLPASKSFPWPLWLARDTRIGSLLVEKLNAFSLTATRVAVTRHAMPKEVRDAYMAPYAAPGDRIATLRFVQDIPLRASDRAWPVVSGIEAKLPTLAKKPMLICWGGKDFVFDKHFLARFRELFPDAKVLDLPDAGHYVLEDAAKEILPAVRAFLEANALPTGPTSSATTSKGVA